jgi:hypothetical protein
MVRFAQNSTREDPADNALDNTHAESVVSAIKVLFAGLSPDQQERVRSTLFPNVSPPPRAGEMLGTILKLVRPGESFTIDDVKKSVEAEGIQATAKAIYNSLGYLTRKQKITRIGHGRYMIEGAGELTTLEELDAGPPTRNMIDDY